ncbi:MAG TPA: NAD(P)-binding domain-containing protein [Flavobacteriales bacterium]|nr:NAD(P)-binding domain-containing protein [Flavobacteriales bacterium]HMR28165.1 NAD(P)-binding domain-containing protein [Flavobacteriales bacterium]
MTITIIGAGNIGGTLAEKWKSAGHDILIGARDPNDEETLKWAQGIGARVMPIADAVKAGDAVLIATPGKVVADLAASLGDALNGKLVMDATNMAGPLGTAPGFEALRATGADAVKVFNCTGWENLADVRYGDQVADMFMAGGSERAKGTVRDLVKTVGFEECHDLGGDDKVPILEGFALVWIDLAIFQRMGRGIAFKLMRR